TKQLKRMSGIDVPSELWDWSQLPQHLRMNFRGLDESNQTLAQGRDLSALQATLQGRLQQALNHGMQSHQAKEAQVETLETWSIGKLPVSVTKRQGAFDLTAYPGLQVSDKGVMVTMFDSLDKANAAHKVGVRELLLANVPSPRRHLQQALPNKAKLA